MWPRLMWPRLLWPRLLRAALRTRRLCGLPPAWRLPACPQVEKLAAALEAGRTAHAAAADSLRLSEARAGDLATELQVGSLGPGGVVAARSGCIGPSMHGPPLLPPLPALPAAGTTRSRARARAAAARRPIAAVLPCSDPPAPLLQLVRDELARTSAVASRVAASEVAAGSKADGVVPLAQHLEDMRFAQGEAQRLRERAAALEKELQVGPGSEGGARRSRGSPTARSPVVLPPLPVGATRAAAARPGSASARPQPLPLGRPSPLPLPPPRSRASSRTSCGANWRRPWPATALRCR
jgi:hypothetical protein